MAAIEKTYTDKYSEYKEFVDWAKDKEYVCPNGTVLKPKEYIYDRGPEDFPGNEIPIAHTPQSLDYFLIKDPTTPEFVRKRMQEVYCDWYWEVLEGRSDEDKLIYVEGVPVEFKKNRKLVWINKPKSNIIYSWGSVQLFPPGSDFPVPYDLGLKRFLHEYELGQRYNFSFPVPNSTWKSAIRKLRKMPLPQGATLLFEDPWDELKPYRLLVL